MTGYSMVHSVSRVVTGETDQIWSPRSPRAGTCGVILPHGSGAPQEFIDLNTQPSSVKLAAGLASAGMPCISGEFGGQKWGNILTEIDAAWTALKSAYPLMRTDKVCIVGVSMGAAGAAYYSQTFPDKVAAVVGLIPLWDLVAFYQADVGGSAAQVGTAWGVTSPAPLPAGADIAANASLAAGIPTLAGYSTVDTTVLPAWVTAYTAAVGGTATVTDTTAGHSDAAVGGMPISTIAQFLVANGA